MNLNSKPFKLSVVTGWLAILIFSIAGCNAANVTLATPTLSPSGVRLDAQVENVTADTRSIGFAQPVQTFSGVTLSPNATISDVDGNPKTLQDIRTGMLIEVTGQQANPGTLTGTAIRILPAPIAAPTLRGDTALANQVVNKFFSSYAVDPSGNSAVKYLSTNLQSQVQKGTPVPLLVGVQNPYPSFNVDPVEPNPNPDTIVFRVTLNYATRIQKVLTLVREGGDWRINQISSV